MTEIDPAESADDFLRRIAKSLDQLDRAPILVNASMIDKRREEHHPCYRCDEPAHTAYIVEQLCWLDLCWSCTSWLHTNMTPKWEY